MHSWKDVPKRFFEELRRNDSTAMLEPRAFRSLLVLGQALLENREEGVYGYFKLYDTPCKGMIDQMLQHEGTVSTSPCVNHVTVIADTIVNGFIQEVSLTPARVDPDSCYFPILNKKEKN